jgi:PhzF family phenazine biosynthesis protein
VTPRRYKLLQVDVFTARPLEGNPLAVLPDARGLSSAEMQAIAREMNLSETTFVLPPESPEADYRVRIYTPGSEIPFAGHPTVGTAHALLELGAVARRGKRFSLRQETLAGVQEIEVEEGAAGCTYTMTQPAPDFAPGPAAEAFSEALRVAREDIVERPQTVSVGVGWHVVPLRSLETVRALEPDMDALATLERTTGVATTVFCMEAERPDCDVRVRSFAPAAGIPEDPVCGSGNGCVGAYIAHAGLGAAPLDYRAEQGSEVGRPGLLRVRVERSGESYRIRVGGGAVTVLQGELAL